MGTVGGRRCDPYFLGPLDNEPVVATGPVRCFAGEERFLPKRKLDERERLWSAVAPQLERVLDREETVLHLLPALHVPSIFEQLGFGVWWSLFFRSALVLTDRRLIEVSVRDWKRAGTLVCSYSWNQVRKLKLTMQTLALKPAKGRAQKWKLPVGGDRKLLKLLVPKIQTLLPVDIHVPQPMPMYHCPECGAAAHPHPKQCGECGAEFKTPGRAAVLALAVPGGGLFYAGHAGLGTLDLLGEAVLFVFVASIFLSASTADEIIEGVVVGLLVLFLTKLESIHLATALVKRTLPERRPGRWTTIAAIGAAASLALIALPPAFSGAFSGMFAPVSAGPLDRDLDLSAANLGWTGGHDPAGWQFGADQNQRSEWIRDDGQALFVFSTPSSESAQQIEAVLRQGGEQTQAMAFAGFECIRAVQETTDEEGGTMLWVRWFLLDHDHDDVHIIVAPTYPEELDRLEADVEAAVRSASWIPVKD